MNLQHNKALTGKNPAPLQNFDRKEHRTEVSDDFDELLTREVTPVIDNIFLGNKDDFEKPAATSTTPRLAALADRFRASFNASILLRRSREPSTSNPNNRRSVGPTAAAAAAAPLPPLRRAGSAGPHLPFLPATAAAAAAAAAPPGGGAAAAAAGLGARVRAGLDGLRRSFKQTLSFRRDTVDVSGEEDNDDFTEEEKQRMREAEASSPPKLINGPSNFIPEEALPQLKLLIPEHLRDYNWCMYYSLLRDGASYTTFFEKISMEDNLLLVVHTFDGEVFGGFNTQGWRPQREGAYYGDGRSWVFRTQGAAARGGGGGNDGSRAAAVVKHWGWTAMNSHFQYSTDRSLAMGGGGEGFAFFIGDDFLQGTTAASETFGNGALAGTPTFKVANIEAWGFTMANSETAARIQRLKQVRVAKKKKKTSPEFGDGVL